MNKEIKRIIDNHKKWSNSYYWTPSRDKNGETIDQSFTETTVLKLNDSSEIHVRQTLNQSRRNYYFNNYIVLIKDNNSVIKNIDFIRDLKDERIKETIRVS